MATVTHRSLELLRKWHSSENHPVWFQAFPAGDQEHLVDDDLTAGYSVAGLLVSVVVLGFTLIASTVWLITR